MNKNNKIYMLIICILVLVILAMGIIMKKLYNDSNKQGNEFEQTETQVDTTENNNSDINAVDNNSSSVNSNQKYCEGTYYGKAQLGTNGSTESEYKLNKDGTYSVNHNNLHEFKGYYIIIDNTITFIEPTETCNGIGEECLKYNSSSMLIKNCEYFMSNIGNTNVKYEKK